MRIACFVFLLLCCACGKVLDIKPQKSLVVPTTLEDVQALLDNHAILNERGLELCEIISDNYYVKSEDLYALPFHIQANYLWDAEATHEASWQLAYLQPINYANIALDALDGMEVISAQQQLYSALKGSALFYRSFAFYQLSQLYCKPYGATAATDPGIVLRLSGDINVVSERASVADTYQRMLDDLSEASKLLPETSLVPTRPTKAAAFGLMARIYLSMRDYERAAAAADSCLKRSVALIDYNDLIPVSSPSFKRFNTETVFYNHAFGMSWITFPPYGKIDTTLFESYDSRDLRKEVFFYKENNAVYFRGSYDGTYSENSVFDGITTGEMYIIGAECAARMGFLSEAATALNYLLTHRWLSGTYIPYSFSNKVVALEMILKERRKEMVFRGQRWSDLRRFNEEGANITLVRKVGELKYELPPHDDRWVLLLPDEVIKRTNMVQNPR